MTQISWPVGNVDDFGMCWALLQYIVSPQCYSRMVSIGILIIIDTSALVFISPRHEDIITYCPSNIRIKDLSSSNKVAGEGPIQCTIRWHDGQLTTFKLPGYHTPKAEVSLLSPQVLLGHVCGESIQTATGMKICGGELFSMKSSSPPQHY